MLLQVMEEGHLTDAKGHKVDFRNTIIILTSNVGSGVITRDTSLGFTTLLPEETSEADYRDMKNKLMKELKQLFRPEFLNRVDEVVVFHELSREHIESIVSIQFDQLNDRLTEHEITVKCTDAGCALLVQEGFDPQFGARPLRRAMQRLVEDPLAEKMLEGAFKDGDTVLVDAEDGNIVFRAEDEMDEPTRLISKEQQ
jgi:ATP-dependent Clp protease ATP-binding subunit ClpC